MICGNYLKVAGPTGSSDGNRVAVGASTPTLPVSMAMNREFSRWQHVVPKGVPGVISGSPLCWHLGWSVSATAECSEYQREEIQIKHGKWQE